MSGPYEAVQTAIVTHIKAAPMLTALTGVYDSPPTRAPFPYAVISTTSATDWSTKTETGREIRLGLTIWDAGEQTARLQMLMADAEAAMANLPRTLDGWRIISLTLARSLIARDPSGPWAGLIDHRLRLFKI
ncbi:MAG: hypothetical protein RL425_1327 [Pseudomonadota bacterium]